MANNLDAWRRIKHEGKLQERRALVSTPDLDRTLGYPQRKRSVEDLILDDSELLIGSLRVEVEWILIVLGQYSSQLRAYTEFREKIDAAIRHEDFINARRLVVASIERFGWSLALLERWILTHLRLRKDEEVNSVLVRILSSQTTDPLVKFVAAAFSYRFNPVVPGEYYRRLADANVKLINTDESTRSYIRFLIGNATHTDVGDSENLARLIYSIGSACAVDQYEFLLLLIQRAEIFRQQTDVRRSLEEGVKPLLRGINDPRLHWLFSANSNPRPTSPAAIFYKSKQAEDKSKELLREFGTAVELIKTCFSPIAEPDSALIGFEEWLLRQPQSSFTTAASAILSAYTNGELIAEVIRTVARFDPQARQLIKNIKSKYATESLTRDAAKKMLKEHHLIDLLFGLKLEFDRAKSVDNDYLLSARILHFRKDVPPAFGIISSDTEIRERLGKKRLQSIKDLPVLLAYSYVSQSQMEISIRIEEFLDSLDLVNPSDLISKLDEESRNHFPAFVIDICTLDQLEHLPLVGGQEEDVIRERLSLLRQVSEYFEEEKDLVQNEIARLVKLDRLRSMAKIMNASRLLVDIPSIERKVKSFFEDEESIATSKSRNFFDLHQLLLGVFLLDEEHGLDAELSNRIRHGKLRERLLNPFMMNGLIADDPKALIDNPSFFPVGKPNKKQRDHIIEAVEEFTKNILNQVNHFGNERAQLRVIDVSWKGFPGLLTAKTAPEGLICVTRLKEESYELFQSALGSVTDLEDIDAVLTECVECIWAALERQLKEARTIIQTELFQNLADALGEVEQKVSDITPDISHDPFARCRSQIGSVCEELAGWFVRPTQTTLPTSRLDEIVELAKLAVETSGWGPFEVEIDALLAGLQIQSEMVGEMYDVFVLLLSNAGKHGANGSTCSISIARSKSNPTWVSVSNLGRPTLGEDIAEAQRLLEQSKKGANREALNREGKSGIGKLVRQLRRIDRKKEVSVEVLQDPYSFIVEFSCDAIKFLQEA